MGCFLEPAPRGCPPLRLDWLLERQPRIEAALAKLHFSQGCTVLYDLSGSYFEGRCCPLAHHG